MAAAPALSNSARRPCTPPTSPRPIGTQAPRFSRSSFQDALFIDIGSTTADLIPIVAGRVAALGYSDAERLASGELVYTGMTRSFVMALASRAPFRWRLDAADERIFRQQRRRSSHSRRLARGRGQNVDRRRSREDRRGLARAARADDRTEVDDADAPEWDGLAAWFAEAQIRADRRRSLPAAVARRCSDLRRLSSPLGIGEGVAAEVARRLRRPCVGFSSLIAAPAEASHCAPAVAVALLAAKALAAGRRESSESASAPPTRE